MLPCEITFNPVAESDVTVLTLYGQNGERRLEDGEREMSTRPRANPCSLPPVFGQADLTPVFGPGSRMVQLGCVECFELGGGEHI